MTTCPPGIPPPKSPPYVIDIMDRNLSRYSKYRVMWLLVFFDLPTETKKDRKAYTEFKKRLLNDGFTMFQFSIYVRHCASRENMAVHARRIHGSLLWPKVHTTQSSQFSVRTVLTPQEKTIINPIFFPAIYAEARRTAAGTESPRL